MARHENQTGKGYILADDAYAAEMQAKLASGEVIQMFHPGRGVSYVDNNPTSIERKRRQGFEDVAYEEEVVRRPVPVRKADKAPERPAPRRSAKGNGSNAED